MRRLLNFVRKAGFALHMHPTAKPAMHIAMTDTNTNFYERVQEVLEELAIA